MERKKYKKGLILAMNKRSNGKCELCQSEVKLEFHHIKKHSNGGQDSLDNLLQLCPTCHSQIDHLNYSNQKCIQNKILNLQSVRNQYYENVKNCKIIAGSNTYINTPGVLQVGMNPIIVIREKSKTAYEKQYLSAGGYIVDIIMLDGFKDPFIMLDKRIIYNPTGKNFIEESNNDFKILDSKTDEIFISFRCTNDAFIINFKNEFNGILLDFNDKYTKIGTNMLSWSIVEDCSTGILIIWN